MLLELLVTSIDALCILYISICPLIRIVGNFIWFKEAELCFSNHWWQWIWQQLWFIDQLVFCPINYSHIMQVLICKTVGAPSVCWVLCIFFFFQALLCTKTPLSEWPNPAISQKVGLESIQSSEIKDPLRQMWQISDISPLPHYSLLIDAIKLECVYCNISDKTLSTLPSQATCIWSAAYDSAVIAQMQANKSVMHLYPKPLGSIAEFK